MERLGHHFERVHIEGEARVHLGDNYHHTHLPPGTNTWEVAAASADVCSLERPETPPSPLSNVPFPRDTDFVKRGLLSDEIHERMSAPGGRLALYGLGGVGYVFGCCLKW